MSDIIQLLPDSVANQIAAGEVIQRPASVIKELVENAVDAEAATINVLVVDAGRTSIQVVDDGKGMSPTDARLSFERHATSKIRKADDLFALCTMGFRGEALASIAAVAQVELSTRMQQSELGTHLTISGSRFMGQEPCSCPVGSNFKVDNLFYNVPARRKFLKSNATELNNIITAFQRIALVYPHIHFTFHSNGVETYNLRPAPLRQRIVDIFGKRINQDLLQVQVDTTICKISGFVGKPESARKKGVHQYFFVNGRYMKHAYFSKAVASAFERLVPTGEQVPYFIYFEVPSGDIDVNIHPTKTEIKFENEQAIWQILQAAVREAVGMFSQIPSLDFNPGTQPDIPVYDPAKSTRQPSLQYDANYNPFKDTKAKSHETAVPRDWEKLFEGMNRQPENPQSLFDDEPSAASADVAVHEHSPLHYQYKGQYIMTAVKSGLMVIDQHRAHERILFEQYLRQFSEHNGPSQQLLFPEEVHLQPAQDVILENLLPQLAAIGFQLSRHDNGVYVVSAIPDGLQGLSINDLILDMVDSYDGHELSSIDEVHRHLATKLSQQAAIPYGQVLGNDEMENLINSLFACSNVNYSPVGKTVFAIISQANIDQILS